MVCYVSRMTRSMSVYYDCHIMYVLRVLGIFPFCLHIRVLGDVACCVIPRGDTCRDIPRGALVG